MRKLLLAFAFAAALSAQTPLVNTGGITNRFSLLSPLLASGSIAQGSIFHINGKNLGPVDGALSPDAPVTALAGVSAQVTVGGATVDVLLSAVSDLRIVALLPSATKVGTGTLTVTVNGQKSAPSPITVVKTSIGIQTASSLAAGPAVMEMLDDSGGSTPNSLTAGIKPLQVGVLHGTGLGPVEFSETAGAPLQELEADIHVFVDGQEARVLFKGRTPGQIGLDEFRIEIPEGVSAGCYVSVGIQFGSNMSNFVSISVAPDGGACPDPRLPLEEATVILKAQGIVRTGAIELVRTASKTPAPPLGTIDSTIDLGAAAFVSTDYSKLVAIESLPSTTIGLCFLQQIAQNPQQTGANSGASTVLDAGTVFTVKGPNGTKQLIKNPAGYGGTIGGGTLLAGNPVPGSPVLPLFTSPGTYTFDNGAGGADVGAFTATINVPEHLVWTEADTLKSISRGAGVDISWTGGDPDANVYVAGSSQLPRSLSPTPTGAQFTCRAHVRDGHLTIPPTVLLALPPTVTTNGVPSGVLQVAMTPSSGAFNAPGVDIGITAFTNSTYRAMEYK